MKKFTTVILILSSIFIMGCSNKNTKSISTLSDAYLHLSEISAESKKVNFETLKSNLDKFEYEEGRFESILLDSPDNEIKYSNHIFKDENSKLEIEYDNTNNKITLVTYSKNSDDKSNFSSIYRGETKFVELSSGLKNMNSLNIESKFKNLDQQADILNSINELKDLKFSNYYLDIVKKISTGNNLNLEDIEKIVGTKYDEKGIRDDAEIFTFKDGNSSLGVFFSKENKSCIQVIMINEIYSKENTSVIEKSFKTKYKIENNSDTFVSSIYIQENLEKLIKINKELFNIFN